jgi:hypothetical protein
MRGVGYKVVCISLYDEDIEALANRVGRLKAAGHRRANRSAVIRAALDAFDESTYRDEVPRRS